MKSNLKKRVFISRYRGPHFKKIRRLGALPGLTCKRPRAGGSLRRKKSCFRKKISISYSSRRKTKIAFSLWSDRATIA